MAIALKTNSEKKCQNCQFVSRNYEKKVRIARLYHAIMKNSQNCEIKSRNYLFNFLFSGGNHDKVAYLITSRTHSEGNTVAGVVLKVFLP